MKNNSKRIKIHRTFIYENLLFEYKIRFLKNIILEQKTFFIKPFLNSKCLKTRSEKIQLLTKTDIFKKYKYKL